MYVLTATDLLVLGHGTLKDYGELGLGQLADPHPAIHQVLQFHSSGIKPILDGWMIG